MFGAVMMQEENCRRFLEISLGFAITRVEVSREKSIVYHPEYRGVRLDIYAKDENNTHYNVEMQVLPKPDMGKRTRYYHSQIDMELLVGGRGYAELSDSYVIFICDFDPFGEEKYCYTFENRCLEDGKLALRDGCRSIFLSTYGKNEDEVSKELVTFLKFVKADLKESTADFGDGFVKTIQESICQIKESRRMEERYMLLEELLKDERAEGKAEGRAESVLELLEELGEIPEGLADRIMEETDLSVLKFFLKKAAHADSLENFIREIS